MQLARFHALPRHPHAGEQDGPGHARGLGHAALHVWLPQSAKSRMIRQGTQVLLLAKKERREGDAPRWPESPGIDDVIGMPVAVCRTLQYVMMHTNAPWSPIHEAHFG